MFRSNLTAIRPVAIQSIPVCRVAACCLRTSSPRACDLAGLGRYYSSNTKLLRHGEEVLPEAVMLNACYEDVIDDIQGHARRFIAHGVVLRVLKGVRS